MDLETLINRLRDSNTREERNQIRLDLIQLMSDLGKNYADNLRGFSESIIRNKEEWFKKSMIECIHQAGREVGYQHETNRVDIEACKALLQVICDMEMVLKGELDSPASDPAATVPSSTSESASLPEEEEISTFGKTPDTEV